MLRELEDPNESFGSVAKRHNASASTLYATAKKYRPDLIAKRKESGVHKQIAKTIDVTDEQRAAAVQAVLSGQTVKEVAADSGIPMPTLYKWVQKAKLHLSASESAVHSGQAKASTQAQTPDNAQESAIISLLAASLNAASAQMGKTPAQVLALLTAHVQKGT